MKKIAFWALALFIMVCQSAFADGYNELWKQFDVAMVKDLPKTALGVLQQIEKQAKVDKQYGSLLKASVCKGALQSAISPDSLLGEVKRIEAEELAVRNTEPVLAAVYQSALAQIYRNNYSLRDKDGKTAQAFFDLSLQHPELLAKTQAKGYEPMLLPGVDSRIFNNDLLHVLAMAAGNYRLLYDFYAKAGNRRAACIVASMMFEKGFRSNSDDEGEDDDDGKGFSFYKSRIVHKLDSFINMYADLPEAGELAIVRANMMQSASDVGVEKELEYINYALSKWGTWQNMNTCAILIMNA